jgi:octaheme c-type cytochrome (tetrathionate reductase family)
MIPQKTQYSWLAGLAAILVVTIAPIAIFLPDRKTTPDPRLGLPERLQHTDHTYLMAGPYEDGPAVTRACLECHPGAAKQVMETAHWRWESDPVQLAGHDEPVRTGKKHLINNFCIGIQSNWPGCTSCHAGYGWVDENFDFAAAETVDCLVCHDTTGEYVKGNGGIPVEGVDLVTVAQKVGAPTRSTCGSCHFLGGGGDAVKHGDLDETLYFPSYDLDIHMGKHDFVCTDCHRTEDHLIKGRSITVSLDDANQVYCTDCHLGEIHSDERIDSHARSVSCQACHIPFFARKEATKTHWDWSKAGEDRPDDPHTFLKIKGEFVYEKGVAPEYRWYDGTADRYILGDEIDPTKVTNMNEPHGSIEDPVARIFPFKVHRAKQVYDTEHNYLLQPKTYGEGGFWTEFDWDQSLRLGSEVVGLAFSGEYDFTETEMFWPTTHMVAPADRALQCGDCHDDSGDGRMDWEALGYDGDPLHFGGRGVSATFGKGRQAKENEGEQR